MAFVFLSCFPHTPRHIWSCAADRGWSVSAADMQGQDPPGTKSRKTKQAIPECMHRHALISEVVPSFSKGTKTLRFTIWFLTRTFRVHTQRRIWLEVGSGPWPVWGDSELKKSAFPSASGGPLRKHSPSVVAPESPSHSFVCLKEQISICSFHFNLTSGVNQ